jgi:hypothetical protein
MKKIKTSKKNVYNMVMSNQARMGHTGMKYGFPDNVLLEQTSFGKTEG